MKLRRTGDCGCFVCEDGRGEHFWVAAPLAHESHDLILARLRAYAAAAQARGEFTVAPRVFAALQAGLEMNATVVVPNPFTDEGGYLVSVDEENTQVIIRPAIRSGARAPVANAPLPTPGSQPSQSAVAPALQADRIEAPHQTGGAGCGGGPSAGLPRVSVVRVAAHSLVLVLADMGGIFLGAAAAYKLLGVPNQVWLQLPIAVLLTVGGFWGWIFGLRALGWRRGLPAGWKELWACLVASLVWAPLLFVPLHYITQGYLTGAGNVVVLALYQVPVNAVTLFGSSALNRER